MYFVLRLISPAGKSARADEATLEALTLAAIKGNVVKGPYLEWSDPDANRGMGAECWTDDRKKAQRFATVNEALACWKAQSLVRPIRPDGRPNRPLTAYSIETECIEE